MSDRLQQLILRRTLVDENGLTIFDRYADALEKMGNANLGANDFQRTFERVTDEKGKFKNYIQIRAVGCTASKKTRNKPAPKPKPKSILDGSAKATKKESGPKKAHHSSDDADVPSDPEPLAKKPKQPKHVVNWGPEKKGNTVEYDEDGNDIKAVIEYSLEETSNAMSFVVSGSNLVED
ncbi:hypothetical protein B0H13DRAFT_1850791 [Mycena leptocephala]|nr:hypothetical protein B0H13DRAFT_1850791 [Mycena leptocephala]